MRSKHLPASSSTSSTPASTPSLAPRLLRPLVLGLLLLSGSPWSLAAADKASTYYEDGLRRFERGDLPGAIIQLKNSIQEDQKMLAAHLLLGKVLLGQGELKAAEAALEEALKQGVSRSEVAVPMAQIYLLLGDRKKLIDQITTSGLPTNAQAEVLTLRGSAYAMSGNVTQAAKSFAEAKALNPRSGSPWTAEAPMLLRLGERDKAKASAIKGTELSPNEAGAWYTLGTILQGQQDLKGALAAQDRALKINPKQVDARVARASIQIGSNQEAEASKDLAQLVEWELEDPRASFLRGFLANRKGDLTAAKTAFANAVDLIDAISPEVLAGNDPLLLAGAMSHRALGNPEKARGYLDILLGLNSKNYAAQVMLASILVDTRDYGRAMILLEGAQRINPEDPQVLFLLGTVNMARKRYVQASEFFEKSAARGGSSSAIRELGFSQLSLGQDKLGLANLEKAFAATPGDGRAGVQLANVYLNQGQTAKALQTAQAIVKREPDNLTMLNFLGNIKGRSGDKKGARDTFMQLLQKDPNFRPAAINLSWLDMEESKFEPARKRLEKLLEGGNKDDAELLYQLAILELRAKRPNEAIAHLKHAHEVQRVDARPGLMLVELYMEQRQPDLALPLAKALAANYSSKLPALLSLARVYLALNDGNNARQVLQEATRVADFDAPQQVQIGRMQLAAGNVDGATYNVQKALQSQTGDLGALLLQVEVEARRGDPAKVDAALKTLNSTHPGKVQTALVGAHVAMSRGQFAAAQAGYRTVFEKEPSTPNAILLARALVAAGELDKALAMLEGWAKKSPNDITALKAVAGVQMQAGRNEAAKKNYQQILALQPTDIGIQLNYAQLLQRMGDAGAVAVAEKALKQAPGNADAADTLGWILVQRGNIEGGLRHLREARLRSPSNGEIRYHLAFALAKLNRKAEAKEELTAALNAQPKLPLTPEVSRLKLELGL